MTPSDVIPGWIDASTSCSNAPMGWTAQGARFEGTLMTVLVKPVCGFVGPQFGHEPSVRARSALRASSRSDRLQSTGCRLRRSRALRA